MKVKVAVSKITAQKAEITSRETTRRNEVSTQFAIQANLVMQMLVLNTYILWKPMEMMHWEVAEKTGLSVQVENGFMRSVVQPTTIEIQDFAPVALNN